jgi:hypothetical protein
LTINESKEYGRNQSWVEDCIIENCAAYRGGGNMAVKAKNCILRNNKSCYIGAAASDTMLFGCFVAGNTSRETYNKGTGIGFCYYIENSTVLDGFNTCGTYGNPAIVNTVIAGVSDATCAPTANITNSVFASDKVVNITQNWIEAVAGNGSFAVKSNELVFDEDGRPVIGANEAIDRGNDEHLALDYQVDALGGQRIYNGKVDIGAIEADWRGVYSKALAKTRLSVVEAGENVVCGDEKGIVLVGGESVGIEWAKGKYDSGETPCTFSVKVAEGASLAIVLNGEVWENVVGDGSTREFMLKNDLALNSLRFECTGSEAAGAELFGFVRHSGGVVMSVK